LDKPRDTVVLVVQTTAGVIMTIVSALALLSAPDVQPWLAGAVMVLRLATAGITFVVAVHRGIRYFRKKTK
jgi:hypothetical protein